MNGPPGAKKEALEAVGAATRAKNQAWRAWMGGTRRAKPERYNLSTFPPIRAIKRMGRWVYVLQLL